MVVLWATYEEYIVIFLILLHFYLIHWVMKILESFSVKNIMEVDESWAKSITSPDGNETL